MKKKRKTKHEKKMDAALDIARSKHIKDILAPIEEDLDDQRPAPRERKLVNLWQVYQWWDELVELRKRHLLRISSIKKGKSKMDLLFELAVLDFIGDPADAERSPKKTSLDYLIDFAAKEMARQGQSAGEVWDWVISIRGLKAGPLAAQLLAQIDDISRAPTASALIRFAGWAVIDGVAERNQKGEKSHFNRKLKGVCWNIADQFIRQRTPVYRDIYDEEKEIQKLAHPDPICSVCGAFAEKGMVKRNGESYKSWHCPESASHRRVNFTPQHIHNRALRKMIKIFLQHLWLIWRESEGLPISEPYVQAILGHAKIIQPQRLTSSS